MADKTVKTLEVELILAQDKLKKQLRDLPRQFDGIDKTSSKVKKEANKLQQEAVKLDDQLYGKKAARTRLSATKQQTAELKLWNQKIKVMKIAVREQEKLIQVEKKNTLAARYKRASRFDKTIGSVKGSTGMGMAGAAGMLGGAAFAVVAAAVGALIGAVTSQVRQGYSAYSAYAKTQAGLVGSGATRAGMMRARQQGVLRGFGPTETMQQARQAALATGQAGAVTTAQSLARTTMMDVGGAANFMGVMTRGGQGFGGKAGTEGKKELRKSIALGFASGLDRARMPEFIQGVGKLVQTQSARRGGDVGVGGFSMMLASMGLTNQSGLQGTRGANMLYKLNESIVKPGGGDYGQALMLQAFGFGKPGGNTTYYEALKRQEGGAQKVENVQALFKETKAQYGGGEEQILALRTMTGLTITQLEGMRDAVENLEGPKQKAALEKAIKKAKPIEDQSLEQMQELGGHAKRIAGLDLRLVQIGEINRENIESMQDSINTLVDKLMPLAVRSLAYIADFLQGVAYMFPSAKEASQKVIQRGNNTYAEFLKSQVAYQKGEISANKFESITTGTREQLRADAALLKGYDATKVLELQSKVEGTSFENFTGMPAFGGGRYSKSGLLALQELIRTDPAVAAEYNKAKRSVDDPWDDEKLAKKYMIGGEGRGKMDEIIHTLRVTADTISDLSIITKLQGDAGKQPAPPPPITNINNIPNHDG